MALTAADMIAYAVMTVWSLLSLSAAELQNPVFGIVLSTKEAIEQLLVESSVVFAPGLLDVLQAADPPTIDFLKKLPTTKKKKLWAVYLLVLQRPGSPPRIYVGSGTEKERGVKLRFRNYRSKIKLPRFVKASLQDGYRITHKGLLCWTSIPKPSQYYKLRVLFVALEAAFAILFWAMQSRSKDYRMPRLCPWSLTDLPYDGTCSHVSVSEQIPGEQKGLTAEEIEAKAAEQRKRRLAQVAARNKVFSQTAAGKLANKGYKKKSGAKAVKLRKFACELCNVAFEDNHALENHYKTQKHQDKVAGITRVKVLKNPGAAARRAADLAAKKFWCKYCQKAFSTPGNERAHRKGKAHKAAVEAASSSSS